MGIRHHIDQQPSIGQRADALAYNRLRFLDEEPIISPGKIFPSILGLRNSPRRKREKTETNYMRC